MPRQLVIFDFDGTLADTWRDIAIALNQTFRDVGLAAPTDEQVRGWIGNGLRRLLEQAVPQSERAPQRIAVLYERLSAYYERDCLATTRLYDGMSDCLDRLSGHGLAVLSNKPTRFLERLIAGLGLAGRFDVLLGGDAVSANKPDPAAVAEVVRAVGFSPAAVWMVGDSAIDVAAGRGAGARTIGCSWGFRGAMELRDAGAEFVVDHPRDIPPLIEAA